MLSNLVAAHILLAGSHILLTNSTFFYIFPSTFQPCKRKHKHMQAYKHMTLPVQPPAIRGGYAALTQCPKPLELHKILVSWSFWTKQECRPTNLDLLSPDPLPVFSAGASSNRQ